MTSSLQSGLYKLYLAGYSDSLSSLNERVLVIEAMKMNHTISADQDGVVKEIFIKVGDQLDLGESLLTLSKDESE